MPRTLGEMQRSRQIRRRSFTERCDLLRAVEMPSSGPGEPPEKTYGEHLAGVPCKYIPEREVETERGGRAMRVRAAVVAMPHGTDVTGDDLIAAVRDIEGNRINAGNLSILEVNRYSGHLECVVEELSS